MFEWQRYLNLDEPYTQLVESENDYGMVNTYIQNGNMLHFVHDAYQRSTGVWCYTLETDTNIFLEEC